MSSKIPWILLSIVTGPLFIVMWKEAGVKGKLGPLHISLTRPNLFGKCPGRTLERKLPLPFQTTGWWHSTSSILDTKHILVYSDTQQIWLGFGLFFFWMLETFIKDTTKILANIPKIRFVNIMLPFSIGSTLKRQYGKTTQFKPTLVQNPYMLDQITYVPTW